MSVFTAEEIKTLSSQRPGRPATIYPAKNGPRIKRKVHPDSHEPS